MGQVSELLIAIQEDLAEGKLSFAEIAAKHEVPISWVDEASMAMAEMDAYIQDNDYLDSDGYLEYLE